MVRENHLPGEELMLVAVTRRLRVETPFTDDVEEILNGLERMKEDPSLWQESPIHYLYGGERFDEFELFDALNGVIDLMSEYDGQKAIVLYSDLPTKTDDAPFARPLTITPAAFDYDQQFQAVAVAATEARVPIYPIHTSGLTLSSPSERLARLAVESGGRFTRNTNDLSLAYARARRDIGCRYAVGFYDRTERPGQVRRVNLKVLRPGLRVHHPVHYRFGVREADSQTRSDTAYTAPAPFQDRAIVGELFAVRPATARRWQALVALNFPVRVRRKESRTVSFGAKLDDGARRAVHTFDTEMTLIGGEREEERSVVFVEPVTLAPGKYELSVVVDDPDEGGPRTAVGAAELPELPRAGLIVGRPLLLTEAGPNVTLSWNDALLPLAGGTSASGLQPLLAEDSISGEVLTAVVHLCWAGKESEGVRVEVERWIRSTAGGESRRLVPIAVDLQGGGAERCQRLAGNVPLESLPPGEYVYGFRVRAAGDEPPVERSVTFTIGEGGEQTGEMEEMSRGREGR
jgi:hypothetical protein